MTHDPLPVALPELPTVAWLVEFGAVSLPKGHPSRITDFEAHHSEADALDAAHCLEYDSLVLEVVRKSDAEAALRAQAEELAALRADAERWRALQSIVDSARGWVAFKFDDAEATTYNAEQLDAAIDAHLASKQEKP